MSEATAICSKCGYDLRGIASERCPECGFELSNQTSLGGEIPWTYRKVRGRARAFFQTVNHVSIGGSWLSRVIAAPVSLRDARAFWFIAATIISLPLIAVFMYVWGRTENLLFVTYLPDPLTIEGNWPATMGLSLRTPLFDQLPAAIKTDLVWPISAGLTRPGVAIVVLWLFVLFATGAPTYLFHPRHLGDAQRQRANAFSYYLCAPLVWATLPLTAFAAAVIYVAEQQNGMFRTPTFIAVLAGILWVATLALYVLRLIKTLRLTSHAGLGHSVAAIVLVPVLWIGCALFTLVFVPWCVGVAWLMFEALR